MFKCPFCNVKMMGCNYNSSRFSCDNTQCFSFLDIYGSSDDNIRYWDMLSKDEEYVLAASQDNNFTKIKWGRSCRDKTDIIKVNYYVDVFSLSVENLDKFIQTLLNLKAFA